MRQGLLLSLPGLILFQPSMLAWSAIFLIDVGETSPILWPIGFRLFWDFTDVRRELHMSY